MGCFWGGIAGALKAYRGVNEIIVTIMMNFIAMYIVNNAVIGPLAHPNATAPYTYSIPESAKLPILVSGTTLHLGFILAILACIAFALWFKHTRSGFRIRLMGLNLRALNFSGVLPGNFQLLAMLLSGGMAGTAGAMEVLGVRYYLTLDWSRGWGWPAIAVAFIARGNPIIVIPVGIFYALFDAGALQVQIATGLPRALVDVMQGLPLVLIIVFQTIQRYWIRSK
jgi:simple sugar transport system permease protein